MKDWPDRTAVFILLGYDADYNDIIISVYDSAEKAMKEKEARNNKLDSIETWIVE